MEYLLAAPEAIEAAAILGTLLPGEYDLGYGRSICRNSVGILWFLNGELHREDGPAKVAFCGDRFWFLNGKMHSADGPAADCADGSRVWYQHGSLHREDGPAMVRSDGCKEWWFRGVRHREDGPAVIPGRKNAPWQRLRREWWLNGKRVRKFTK